MSQQKRNKNVVVKFLNVNVTALTDDIRLPFSLGEKRKLRAARGSGITATLTAECRLEHKFKLSCL